jgi:2-dehydropantoate 2-reductase
VRKGTDRAEVTRMRILVYGAGVQGSLYAARFQESGHDVTLLARGARLEELRVSGIVLEDALTGRHTRERVRLTTSLEPESVYDLALIAVRRDQVDDVLPVIAAARGVPIVLFMHNHAGGSRALLDAVGAERVVLGFPGAGGERVDAAVRYVLIPQQATTIGEPSGRRTPRIRMLRRLLRSAGFPTGVERHMDRWLNVHAVFVTAVVGALYLSDGDTRTLAADRCAVVRLVQGVREGFRALATTGSGTPPINLRAIFEWVPDRFAVSYWQRYLSRPMAEFAFGAHARAAAVEMAALAREIGVLVHAAVRPTATLDALWDAIQVQAAARDTRR